MCYLISRLQCRCHIIFTVYHHPLHHRQDINRLTTEFPILMGIHLLMNRCLMHLAHSLDELPPLSSPGSCGKFIQLISGSNSPSTFAHMSILLDKIQLVQNVRMMKLPALRSMAKERGLKRKPRKAEFMTLLLNDIDDVDSVPNESSPYAMSLDESPPLSYDGFVQFIPRSSAPIPNGDPNVIRRQLKEELMACALDESPCVASEDEQAIIFEQMKSRIETLRYLIKRLEGSADRG